MAAHLQGLNQRIEELGLEFVAVDQRRKRKYGDGRRASVYPLLVVIVTFGLIFVVTASLGQGFSMTTEGFRGTLGAHRELNLMLLIGNFIVMPALIIGLASLIDFNPQVRWRSSSWP